MSLNLPCLIEENLSSFFQKHNILTKDDCLAVAVSGGPDSMALARMLMVWSVENDKTLHIISVDHGLRLEAKDEVEMVGQWVASQDFKDVQHIVLDWSDDKPETALMENARHARYQLMVEYCRRHQIKNLYLGHHQGDQAETFLIRLSKGSGLDGLASMQDVREYDDTLNLVRPLLNLSKQDLISYCSEHDIPYVEDPSNEDESYLRPRLRQSVDVLSKEGLTPKRLGVTAKRISRARFALEEITESALIKCSAVECEDGYSINFDSLREYPEEIGLRVIQNIIEKMRPDAEYNVRMEKLEELFEALWFAPDSFKPRTLGGCIFSLKCDKSTANRALYIQKEYKS